MSFLVRGAALGAVALLALTGCGDDPEPAAGSPAASSPAAASPTPSPGSEALSADQVKAALLTAEDLPAGWTRTGGGDGAGGDTAADDSADTTEPARCGELFGEDTGTGAVAEAEADFENKQLAFLTAGVASFDEAAAPQLQQFEDALKECPEFTSTDKDGLTLSYKAAPLDFPDLGDRTLAVRMTGSAEGIAVKVDVVLVAIGQNAVSVIGGGLTPLPSAQLESIAEKAVEKVRAGRTP